MVNGLRRALAVVAMVMLVFPLAAAPAGASSPAVDVLVYTGTEPGQWEHASTSASVELLEMHGRRFGFSVTATADPAVFTADGLADYDVVLWVNNTGSTLDSAQRVAFEEWIGAGGGFVGVHAAARAEPDWPYFGRLVGAVPVTDETEPVTGQPITVNTGHPSTNDMPVEWNDFSDQWYRFDRDPAVGEQVSVLATIDVGDGERPLAWCQPFEGGRSWYTALGHSADAYQNGEFMKMLRGGIWWAAGMTTPLLVQTHDAAPGWPYIVSFLAWIASIAIGGTLAVVRLNSREALI
ncbi:ThuA domain-containing protein [Stackebrandtia soli]|uniref:ThuA domain-containing protein n=1 Tax=Stackebrandtia soli TaxID=1892856 RepID=UPI0039EBA4EB